jgi:hypothetical protein
MASVLTWVQSLGEAEKNQDYECIRAILQGAIPEFRKGS